MEVEVKAGAPETPEAFAARRDAEIKAWLAAKTKLVTVKEQEASKRLTVAQMLFPNPTLGTQRYDLGGGYKIKLAFKYTYTLGNKEMIDPLDPTQKIPVNKQVEQLEEAIYNLGNAGPSLAERLIKWTPSLNDAEYRKLNLELDTERQAKELIDTILTIKPASPTLEFEEPKAAK
jgi:hypothetical protein